MLAKRAKLRFKDFIITKWRYEFIPFPPESTTDSYVEILNTYALDIDFVFQPGANQEGNYLFTKISINESKQAPGYSIFIEGSGFIEKAVYQNMNDQELIDQVNLPAINYAINQLRAAIQFGTALGPLGKYLVPAIDLNDLIKEKINEARRNSAKDEPSSPVA